MYNVRLQHNSPTKKNDADWRSNDRKFKTKITKEMSEEWGAVQNPIIIKYNNK